MERFALAPEVSEGCEKELFLPIFWCISGNSLLVLWGEMKVKNGSGYGLMWKICSATASNPQTHRTAARQTAILTKSRHPKQMCVIAECLRQWAYKIQMSCAPEVTVRSVLRHRQARIYNKYALKHVTRGLCISHQQMGMIEGVGVLD